MIGHMLGNGYYGNWDSTPDYMQNMMQSYYGGLRPFGSLLELMHVITWAVLVAFVVALTRYFWKKGGK